MKPILLLSFLLTFSAGFAQVKLEWATQKKVNYLNVSRMNIDGNGNSFVAHASSDGNKSMLEVTRYNSSGTLTWTRTYDAEPLIINDEGIDYTEAPYAVVTDKNGNIIITGTKSAYSSVTMISYEKLFTVKYSAAGDLLWKKTFFDPSSVRSQGLLNGVDNTGNIYVVGTEYASNWEDYLVIKYDADGNELWAERYNDYTLGPDYPTAIALDQAGNLYVTGSSMGEYPTGWNYLTIKYSSSGVRQWVARFHESSSDNANAIALDDSGNVYVTGSSEKQNGTDRTDFATVKYNPYGQQVWVQRYSGLGGSKLDQGESIAVDPDGNVYVSGRSEGIVDSYDMDYAVVKYNSDGSFLWDARYSETKNYINEPLNHLIIDDSANVYITGYCKPLYGNQNVVTVKYNSSGQTQWIQKYNEENDLSDYPESFTMDKKGNLYLGVISTDRYNGDNNLVILKYAQFPQKRYPVFIVPGIAATYSANLEHDLGWLLSRGITPDSIQIDPLGRVYDDLIITFENAGYVKDKDLFVVTYDWRLPPGPVDNSTDGRIEGLSGTSITSRNFNYGVDYLGWFLKKASDRWRQEYNEELDSVDIIAHSTGGLVSRTYIQSDSYGSIYDLSNNYHLPRVRNFVMLAVPNRGASKPWNLLHDNWTGDIAYRFVLSKIVNRAYQKVLAGKTITGPDYDIDKTSILDNSGNPDKELFISRYVPTIRYLLATYDFIDFGQGLTNINNDTDTRNTLLLDLNNGFDLNPLNDPNGFLDSTRATVIYGTGVTTKSWVDKRSDFELFAVQSLTDFTPGTAFPGTTWYKDIEFENNGDGTVPTTSSAGQFLLDNRSTRIPFSTGNHTELVSQVNVQAAILDLMDVPYDAAAISTGNSTNYDVVLHVISDPVETVITDGSGRRLGFTQATSALTEIPNSIWLGNTEGMGYVFGSIQLPVNLQLTGLGENYYVMVSVEDSGKYGGIVLEGFLARGEVLNYQLSLDSLSLLKVNSLPGGNFVLEQNYPNPFNQSTVIRYSVPVPSKVSLKIYSSFGVEVATPLMGEKPAGTHEFKLDAAGLSPGVYFCRFQAGSFVQTRKMILLR